jgi:hypothetical protein
MRIVSQAELKAMPPGTLYAEYSAGRGWPDGPTDIFVGDNEGMNDFFLKSLGSPASSGSGNLFARQHEMDEKGTSYPIGLETDREGLYDDTCPGLRTDRVNGTPLAATGFAARTATRCSSMMRMTLGWSRVAPEPSSVYTSATSPNGGRCRRSSGGGCPCCTW